MPAFLQASSLFISGLLELVRKISNRLLGLDELFMGLLFWVMLTKPLDLVHQVSIAHFQLSNLALGHCYAFLQLFLVLLLSLIELTVSLVKFAGTSFIGRVRLLFAAMEISWRSPRRRQVGDRVTSI